MERQRAKEHGGRGISRNTQRQERNHGTADGRIVCRFRGNNAVDSALPEFLGMLVGILCNRIGQHVGGAAADARQNADAHADESRAQRIPELGDEFLHGKAEALDALHAGLRHDFLIRMVARLSSRDDLAYCKETDHDGQHVKAALKAGIVKGEPSGGLNGVRSHGGEHEADDTGHNALDHIAA